MGDSKGVEGDEMNAPAMDVLFKDVKWEPVEVDPPTDGTPYATHEGILQLGNHSLRVVQLNDGRRVIDADDLREFFGESKI